MIKTVNLTANDPLELFLGHLEAFIMRLIWAFGKCQIKRIHKAFPTQYSVTYSTVATTMNRLVKKGLLKRIKENGHYWYTATVVNEQVFLDKAMNEVYSKIEDLKI